MMTTEVPPAGGTPRETGSVAADPAPPPPGFEQTGDIVEEWGQQSFPASDPPANW
jgi:hypothetical protein